MRRRRQRQQHVLEEAHRPGAVDARRFDQFIGHGEEELAEQEGRGGRGDQRHRQAGVAVEHAEVRHHLVGRTDAHLHRQHQRDEDRPEEELPEREAEVDDRKRRQQRDRDLAEGDDQRADEAHRHHAAHRHLGARPAALAGEGLGVVDCELIAGDQRHRRLRDALRGVRRGDEGDVDREGDDQHADDQHEVRQRGEQWFALDHFSSSLSSRRSGTARRSAQRRSPSAPRYCAAEPPRSNALKPS